MFSMRREFFFFFLAYLFQEALTRELKWERGIQWNHKGFDCTNFHDSPYGIFCKSITGSGELQRLQFKLLEWGKLTIELQNFYG